MRLTKTLITIFAILITVYLVLAIPQQPTAYQGYVKVDGQTPPTGTTVYVFDQYNNTVGNDTTGTTASGIYSLNVGRESTDNISDGSVVDDETIYFYVAGTLAHTRVVNDSGLTFTVNLSISDISSPSAPSSLVAIEISAGTINLSWSAATDDIGVQKYLVYRGTNSGVTNDTGTNIGNTTDTNYTNSGLTANGSTYYYVVTAMDTANEGSESNEVNVTVTDSTAPSAPTGLTVSDQSGAEGTLFVSWSANSENDLSNYTLYNSTDNTTFSSLTTTANTNYTDTGLTDGSAYYYKLMAQDTSGNPSSNSSVVSGTPTDSSAPIAVTGLTTVDVTSTENQLNISWIASVSSDTQGYFLFRDDSLIINLTGINNVSHIDTGVTDGTNYSFKVSAYDEVPNFASNTTTTGVPIDDLSPKAVTISSTVASNHTINITWSNVTQNSDSSAIQDLIGYHVYMNDSGNWYLAQNTTAGTLSYYNSTLTNGVTYYFKVTAYDDVGNEGTNTSTSGTPSERPTLSASPANGTEIKSSVLVNITITSGSPLDVTSYEIYNSSGQQLSDNQTNSTGGVTTWNYSINPSTWSEISHKVVVFANDTNGQSNQENFTYIIDDTTPSVSGAAFSDADNIVRHADSITLNVTITDTNTIASVLVANDSSISMSVLSGNIYYVTTNATELGCSNTDGDCTVTFTATDSAGNVNNSHTYTFTIDDIYPSVTGAVMAGGLINLTDNIVRENDTIEVNITVSDTNNITSVTVNGQSMNNITATTYNYTGTALSLCGASEGACTLQFNATDISGNLNSSTTLAMTVDDTVSTVNLVSLSEDYVQNNTVVVVTVNVSDTHSSVYNVTAEGYSLTNQGVDVWNASINLTSGNNVVDVVVYDIVGNQQTDNSTSFTIDDVSPVIHSATLEDDYTQNGTLVLLTVNVTDNSISTVTAEGISLTRSQSFQDLWTGNVTLFSGDLVINVSATDNASNTAVNESTTYTIDDTSPGINSVSLADNYVRTGQIVQITVNVTDGYTYSVTANISGTTSSLVNTTTDTWIGNLTIPSSSGLVEIVAVDGADNSNTTNSTTFTVDDTSPSFSIIVPASSGLYTNDDGNITFNFTVSDASLAKVNVSIDNATYKNGSAVNGTHIWLFTDLRAGLHTAVFTAMDNADNNATSVSRSFHMIRPLNVSEAIDDLETGLGSAVTGFNISNSAGDISSNESADINTTLTIEMNLNLSGTNVSVTIPDFDGLDVNWEQTFTVVTNESSVKALTATSRAGSNISAIVLFENMGYFLAEEEFGMAEITFDVVLADLDVLYIADDIGETIYKLSACSSTPTSVANVAAACYTNTSANVTMYLPHFSGGALANDTQAPDINITYPANNTEVNNSYFNLTFYAYEANPNTDSFCTYVFNGSIYDNDIDTSDMSQTGTRYDFNSELTQFADGDYNLSVNCTDLNNRTSTQIYAVSINDSVNPAISSSGPSGAQSTTSTSLSVTLTATTDEKSICKYDSANVSYASMDDFLGSNTTYALTHETSISYSGDDSSESYYVRCADLNGEVSDSTLISYSVDVGSADDGSGAGAGDGTGTSVTTYTKSWLEIAAGSTRISSIDQSVYDGVPFTQIEFEALNDMTNVEVQVRALTSAPSSTGTITYNAYSYLQIVESFGEDDITNTKIQFKVPKVWLATESISNDNVALFRYNDDVWEEQETTITSEDSDNVYYEAVTTGFSYFAIGQLVEEVVEEETEEVVETEEEEEVVEEEITGDVVEDLEEEELVEKQSKVWIWILLLVVIALGGFTFWFVKQKPKGSIKHYELKTHEVHRVDGGVDKLETFVKTYLDKGYSEEQIRRSLKNVGWSDMMIDDVFKRMK